jgi:NitT/TauT family transport system permease protein
MTAGEGGTMSTTAPTAPTVLLAPGPSHEVARRRVRRIAVNLLVIVVVLVVWEAFVRVSGVGKLLLPAPSSVAVEATEFTGLLLSSSLITLAEAVIGFLIAVVVGITLALVITYSTTAGGAIMNSLVAVNATPKVAVAPILIIWLGLGIESKIALAFLLSFFPIVVNGVRGFNDVPHDLLNLYRLMHATTWQVFRKVRLPSALPAIFDGFKIALPVAMVGAVAGEFVAARSGLGFQIVLAYANFNSALVFAAVILIALEATLLFQVLVFVEEKLLFWRPSKQKF